MSSLLCLTNSYPIHPRLRKLARQKCYEAMDVTFVAWNRGKKSVDDDTVTINSSAGYNKKTRKIFSGFFLILKLAIIFFRCRPKVVLARYWDMMFVCAFLKLFFRFELHYDVCDMPSRNLLWLERLFRRYVDRTYLASRFYNDWYSDCNNKLVFENKVDSSMFLNEPPGFYSEVLESSSDKLRLAFVGGVRYFSIFRNLLLAISQAKLTESMEFHIFGDGIDLNKVKTLSKELNLKNVYFHGRYKYQSIKFIYELSDFVWAVYDSQSFNVKYAISNKYFECLHFSVPAIYSKNTCLGEMVSKSGVGLTVDESSLSEIIFLLERLVSNKNTIIKEVKVKINSSLGM